MANHYSFSGDHSAALIQRAARRSHTRQHELPYSGACVGFLLVLGLHVLLFLLIYGGNPAALVYPGSAGAGSSINFCSQVYVLLPAVWETDTTCRVLNMVPFLCLPTLMLGYIAVRLIRDTCCGGR